MNKYDFHKQVEILAQKKESIKDAFEILNSKHKIFTTDVCYRNWKSKNKLATYIFSRCVNCNVELKSTKKKLYCNEHVGGRKSKAKPKINGVFISNEPLHSVWNNIKHRCNNIKNIGYKNYGGRGVQICNLWLNDFYEFKKWSMSNGYVKGLQIDRINNNGNYEPNNCRYVEPYVNCANRRSLTNTSGFVGVSKNNNSNSYRVLITIKNKSKHLGCFKNKITAAIFRDKYIIENNLPHTRNLL